MNDLGISDEDRFGSISLGPENGKSKKYYPSFELNEKQLGLAKLQDVEHGDEITVTATLRCRSVSEDTDDNKKNLRANFDIKSIEVTDDKKMEERGEDEPEEDDEEEVGGMKIKKKKESPRIKASDLE